MTPRYVIHLSEGFRTAVYGHTRQGPGVTASVHDRLLLYRTVGLFRSEDYRYPPGHRGALPKPQMLARAIEDAQQLAQRLNRAAA